MLEKTGLLEHVADRPLVGLSKARSVLPDLAIDRTEAAGQILQPGEAARHRGLAAAGRTKDCGHAARRCLEASIEQEISDLAAKARLDMTALAGNHALVPLERWSISVMVRITAKAKTTMPPARMLASRHCEASTKSKIATDSTLVRPGILPPIISTRPNSPTVWANPSTAPARKPGRASGTATVQKARRGEARKVAATSSGRSPIAANALRIGCTTNGIE